MFSVIFILFIVKILVYLKKGERKEVVFRGISIRCEGIKIMGCFR